jgi:hypothetical protein
MGSIDRQDNLGRGPRRISLCEAQRTPMLLDDRSADREPKPRTIWLCRVERIEYVLAIIVRYSVRGIANANRNCRFRA